METRIARSRLRSAMRAASRLSRFAQAASSTSAASSITPPATARACRSHHPWYSQREPHALVGGIVVRQLRRDYTEVGFRLPDRNTRLQTSRDPRSEEHTSELQSLRHLVCRLLLEKK